jgi:hypothetical protein
MKKLDYMTPSNVVINLHLSSNVLLSTSDNETPGIGGEGDDEHAG